MELAIEEIEHEAGERLSVPVRERLVYWICRAHEAGRWTVRRDRPK